MLIYIDNPTYLRVYRANDGPIGPKRILVGRILKANYQFVGYKKAELASAEEEIDVQRVIQACKDAHQTKLRSEALSFPEVARRVITLFREIRPPDRADYHLTPHELRLLKLFVEGHIYKTAAVELGVSVNTVNFHVRNIYEKLQVHTRSEAVAKALVNRLV